jgi:prevent-host-death family protein
MDVGIRELKSQLSHFVGCAANGESIVVTDRGSPVARLVPFAENSAVERGIREGWIDPSRRTKLLPVDRQRSATSVLDVLDEDRG